MSKQTETDFQTKVITANMLAGGNVVYLAAGGSWDKQLANARIIENDDELARLNNVAQDALINGIIVGPYAMDAAVSTSGPQPLSKREQIRASGPTIQADYSEQAVPNV